MPGVVVCAAVSGAVGWAAGSVAAACAFADDAKPIAKAIMPTPLKVLRANCIIPSKDVNSTDL